MMDYEKYDKNNCYDHNDKKEYCYKSEFCKMEPVWYKKICKCHIEKMDKCNKY